MIEHSKKVLANGLRVITAPQVGTQAVTAMVFAKVGSRNETKQHAGIAHFIEHLAFKGTKKYPTTLIMSKKLDSVGADFNAFTSKDYTGYWIKVDTTHLDLALDILSQMTFQPLYVPEEIEREKGVIVGEIDMYEDTPMYLTDEYFEEQLYGTTHALGREIIGSKKTVKAVTRKDIVAFQKKFYVPKNLILSVAGAVPDDIDTKIKKLFTNKRTGSIPTTPFVTKLPPKQPVYLKYKDTEQVHLVAGLPVSLRYGHTDLYKAKIANIAFGASMSSRLFITVRERHGLGYYISSGLNVYEDVANWQVRAGVDKQRIDTALGLITKEWRRLAQGLSKSEFIQAKEYYKGKLALQLEDSAAVAQWYAKQELFSLPVHNPDEVLAQVDALTLDQVNAWLKQQVKPAKLRLTLVGPFKDQKHFSKYITQS